MSYVRVLCTHWLRKKLSPTYPLKLNHALGDGGPTVQCVCVCVCVCVCSSEAGSRDMQKRRR
jgi:hypothetical protein